MIYLEIIGDYLRIIANNSQSINLKENVVYNKKMECQFCKKILKNKYTLQNHQAKTKYCLKIQKKILNDFPCKYCNKKLCSKRWLENHYNSCIPYHVNITKQAELAKHVTKDELIADLKAQVRYLQKQMADISMKAVSRPTTTTNTITTNNNQKILNLLPLTENHFEEQAEFLNLEHIKNGAEGYARYAVDFPLKNRLICSDYARRKVKYKDTDGKVVTDPEMSKLSQKLFKAIDTKNDKLITGYVGELQKQLFQKNKNCSGEMDEKETEIFGCEANEMIDFITNLINQKREIKEAANGIKSDMYYNILKNVCSMMV